MEKDADTLKPVMARYLEQLMSVLETYHDDIEELKKVSVQLSKDYAIIQETYTRVNEETAQLTSLKASKDMAANALTVGIRERK